MNRVTAFIKQASLACVVAASLGAAPESIDLPTVLRLAGADSLQVKIAREKLAEAQAQESIARAKLFPWLSVGATLRQHENNIQTVDGQIIDADKRSLAAGLGANFTWDPSEVYFQNLSVRQLARAEEAAFDASRQTAVYESLVAYFELLRAQALVDVEVEALKIVGRHYDQVEASAEAGLVFAGDVHRLAGQRARGEIALRQAREAVVSASARLATFLKLDPTVELDPVKTDLVPLAILDVNLELGLLVSQALGRRPELTQFDARVAAAREERTGAHYGPLIPTITAQMNYGGLGGGPGLGDATNQFDVAEDYALGVAWRVGPGGLFDRGRIRLSDARLRRSELELELVRDQIRREVVEQHARVLSWGDQVQLLATAAEAAGKTAELSRQRREQGVGPVLEDILAEEELTRTRRDYATGIARYNQAQYALLRAIGSEPSVDRP